MTLSDFVAAAWRAHGDESEEVAERIADSLHLVAQPEDVAPFVRLLTHVYGEHLGRWQRGVELLEAIQRSPACDGNAAATEPLRRGIAALRVADGDGAATDSLTEADRAYAFATAADALAARGELGRGIELLERALACVPADLGADHPAIRALAITGNNVSAALEIRETLDARESAAMVRAAEAGLRYWKLAGTWLEEERAEYQLARSLLRAGDVEAARERIDRCIEICRENDAPAFERFFGHAVRALVARAAGDAAGYESHRQAALEHYARVPDGEQSWCDRERSELESEPALGGGRS